MYFNFELSWIKFGAKLIKKTYLLYFFTLFCRIPTWSWAGTRPCQGSWAKRASWGLSWTVTEREGESIYLLSSSLLSAAMTRTTVWVSLYSINHHFNIVITVYVQYLFSVVTVYKLCRSLFLLFIQNSDNIVKFVNYPECKYQQKWQRQSFNFNKIEIQNIWMI